MRRKRVYLESSVISYLTATPPKDILKLTKQHITKVWWGTKDQYDLFISETVIDEISRGDATAALQRLNAVHGIVRLSILPTAYDLARALLASNAVPEKCAEDALHIAIAATNNMDYILTWNQKHIANSHTYNHISTLIRGFLLLPPLIITPEQLMESLS